MITTKKTTTLFLLLLVGISATTHAMESDSDSYSSSSSSESSSLSKSEALKMDDEKDSCMKETCVPYLKNTYRCGYYEDELYQCHCCNINCSESCYCTPERAFCCVLSGGICVVASAGIVSCILAAG